ncbi:hypothetical protein DPEC_G00323850 [Dallia pectoralis]|uniref:Uncharacterized protein n=1 Tax=Dallia pectoralis TaxID=75939 RepID=A0ACC2FAT2_DALPE|nr:hypothetical protein DPEC_G00323850 [Dallia pectoralis]
MAEKTSDPDTLVKSESVFKSTKEKCTVKRHKEMERALSEMKDELRRIKDEAEQAERSHEEERKLLELYKNQIKNDREKKSQLFERALKLVQEETDTCTLLEYELEKMKEELETLRRKEKNTERRLRNNMEEEFEKRLQSAIQQIELKKSVEMETLKATCCEKQSLKVCDDQLRTSVMRTTGRERRQQFKMLMAGKTPNASLTEPPVPAVQTGPNHRSPIMCRPKPVPDLTPNSWLYRRTQQEPVPDPEPDSLPAPETTDKAQDVLLVDIEFGDNQRVDDDDVHIGRTIPLTEIKEAKQKLVKESEEAQHELLMEQFKPVRKNFLENLKAQHEQFLEDDDEEIQDIEDDQVELSVDKWGGEILFNDMAERKAYIKKSVRRRMVNWLNKMAEKTHEKKIMKSCVKEESNGDQVLHQRIYCAEMTRARFEQVKRARLVRAEEDRKRSFEDWLRTHKEKSLKKQTKRLQNMQKSNI